MSQFAYQQNDIHSFDVESLHTAKIISAVLTIESQNPGTLNHVLRIMALAADDWKFKSNSSDPVRALKVQRELESWLSNDN